MFTFKIVQVLNKLYGFQFTVEFYQDGKLIDTLVSGICYPYNSVFSFIQGKLNILQAVQDSDVTAQSLLNAVDMSANPGPTDLEKARSAVTQLQQFKVQYIDTGLFDSTDPTYVALQEAVKAIIPDGSVALPTTALPITVQITPPTQAPLN